MFRLVKVARFGWAEFAAQNPWPVVGATMLPRAALQSLFFTMLATVLGGAPAGEFVFVGSLAAALALTGAVGIVDVPMLDKWSGTFHKVRSAVVSPFVILALRALPYPIVGVGSVLVTLAVVGPATGHGWLALRLLPWMGVYAVMAFTTSAAGLAAAALAVGRRADVVVGNLLSYLILLAGGVFLPPGRLGWVDAIGVVVPVRHGVAAIRAGLQGRAWLPELAAEVAVGAGWAVIAWLVVTVQVRRARASGHDDFA